jgi:hypothetical protein
VSINKCVIILSSKSSGSSACQNLLAKFADLKCVSKTRHFRNETLYWTKAASILGLPQKNMLDSEVPIPREKAKADLVTLLRDNLGTYSPPDDDKELIFEGWKRLCHRYAPIFLEKSPHHLYQWSALELIIECMELLDDVDFFLIGLVRNPMDTLYSAFQRWRTFPEKLQYEWLVAYQNLLRLSEIVGDKLIIVRYEDIVSSLHHLQPVFDFCGVRTDDANHEYLHKKSIQKWKNDKFYGFALSEEVIRLAGSYGYDRDELLSEGSILWPVYRYVSRAFYKATRPGRKILSNMRQKVTHIFKITIGTYVYNKT